MISGMAGICYIECTDNLDRKGKLCSWIFWNSISVFAVTGICEKRNFKSRFYKFSFQMSELFHNKHFISVRIISQVCTLQKQMKNITHWMMVLQIRLWRMKYTSHMCEIGMAMRMRISAIRINFHIIRQYHAISHICQIYPTYASMRIAKNIRMPIPSFYSSPNLLVCFAVYVKKIGYS